MNAVMDARETALPSADDVSTLSWVHGELRKSLENAHKALRRYLKEAEAIGGSDVDAVDPAVLRAARVQIHQGVGALELVGQTAAAQLLRASEAAVQRMVQKPAIVDTAAVEVIERASFALLDYLARVLAGKPVSPVALFPQYRAAQTLAGADRVHPADLWVREWSWQEVPVEAGVAPRVADDGARSELETRVLALMRQPDPATLAATSELCAGLAAGAGHDSPAASRLGTLWQLAAAFFEAQAQSLLGSDVYTKRVASRLLGQLRSTVRGEGELSDRLAQDLLFFCTHAKAPTAAAPRLAAVRRAWPTDAGAAVDYETPRLGRYDPALIAQAKKRVAGARDAWSAVAGGEAHRLSGLGEQFALVGDSLQRLFPSGEVLAGSLQTAVTQTVASGVAPAPQLAMEVATSILYLDASLEDAELDHPELAGRVQRLARRIDDVRIGAEAQPLEAWMEELYRRVSDRQTMGSVVQELRSSLSDVEKQIDQYFRDPSKRELLIPVPGQLSSMRGVLSVLGLDQASQAVLHMRDDVDALAQTEVDPQRAVQAGTFDRLADNLGALSFLIDMLSVQPALAKSLFRYDATTGNLAAVMGQSERQSAFAAFDSTQAPTDDLAPPPPVAAGFEPMPVVSAPMPLMAPPPAPAAAAPAASSGLEDDAEMREIFIEEAREVVEAARASLAKLADQPEDLGEMTAVRRAFHTLKGSSRMVGLRDFGEAAWACEQLYNAHLAQSSRLDAPLRALTVEALDYMGAWTEAIAAGRNEGHASPAVVRAADALRLDGHRLPIAPPGVETATTVPMAVPAPTPAPAAPEPAPAPVAALPELPPLPELAELAALATIPEPAPVAEPLQARVPDLPAAADLDFDFDLAPAATPAAAEPEVGFDLDLDAFDAEPVSAVEKTTILPTADEVPDAPLPAAQAIELDLADLDFGELVAPPVAAEPAPPPAAKAEPEAPAEPAAAAGQEPEPEAESGAPVAGDDEQVKVIGSLRIGIPLFNIFLNEADELSRRLTTDLAEWAHEHDRHPVSESSVALAHSLAGSSATVGYGDL